MYKILVVGLLYMGLAHADSYRSITWTDLQGKVEAYDDPFKKLTENQLYHLSIYARMPEVEKYTPKRVTDSMRKEVLKAEKILKEEGVDIDYLLSQREHIKKLRKKAAYSLNSELNNTRIKMSGFMLALALDKGKTNTFLLVPTVGACIHTPPPPPNQIVYVETKTAVEAGSRYKAITVKGVILNETSKKNLFLVDGNSDINSGYILKADSIEKYLLQKKR